jgi:hypothetical protein
MTTLFSCHTDVSAVLLAAQWELLEKRTGCCDCCTAAVVVWDLKTSMNNLKIKICQTIVVLFVVYECETWSITLNDERRLRVSENRVLRRMFGPKRDEVTG